MSHHSVPYLALLSLILVIAGCTNLSGQRQESTTSFVARQVLLAQQQEQHHELATALSHWQVVLLLDPAHEEALQRRMELANTLSQRADTAFDSGLRAFRSGNHKKAKAHFLEALAAVPGHSQAKLQLAQIQTTRMLESQKKKAFTEREYKTPSPNPSAASSFLSTTGQQTPLAEASVGIQALQILLNNGQYRLLIKQAETKYNQQDRSQVSLLLGQAYAGIANKYILEDKLQQAGLQFDKAKSLLADEAIIKTLAEKLATGYHQNGRKLLTTDIDKGISYLQESLRYDPSSRHVQSLLKQSLSLKKRLSEIGSKN